MRYQMTGVSLLPCDSTTLQCLPQLLVPPLTRFLPQPHQDTPTCRKTVLPQEARTLGNPREQHGAYRSTQRKACGLWGLLTHVPSASWLQACLAPWKVNLQSYDSSRDSAAGSDLVITVSISELRSWL